MLRTDLQTLMTVRLREAKALLNAKQFCGAYYLTGLAIECAIKACIAKQTQQHEFPDKARAIECFEHDPARLIKSAGLKTALDAECSADPQFSSNWAIIKNWNVASRYEHSITRAEAREIYSAAAARKHGVLKWLRNHW
jgi:hypothetical protein